MDRQTQMFYWHYFMMLMVNTCHYVFVKIHRTYNIKSDSSDSHGLPITMCRYWLITPVSTAGMLDANMEIGREQDQ